MLDFIWNWRKTSARTFWGFGRRWQRHSWRGGVRAGWSSILLIAFWISMWQGIVKLLEDEDKFGQVAQIYFSRWFCRWCFGDEFLQVCKCICFFFFLRYFVDCILIFVSMYHHSSGMSKWRGICETSGRLQWRFDMGVRIILRKGLSIIWYLGLSIKLWYGSRRSRCL